MLDSTVDAGHDDEPAANVIARLKIELHSAPGQPGGRALAHPQSLALSPSLTPSTDTLPQAGTTSSLFMDDDDDDADDDTESTPPLTTDNTPDDDSINDTEYFRRLVAAIDSAPALHDDSQKQMAARDRPQRSQRPPRSARPGFAPSPSPAPASSPPTILAPAPIRAVTPQQQHPPPRKQHYVPSRPRITLADALATPRVLASILLTTPWEAVQTLAQVSRATRRALWTTHTKDVVLAQYVPGYRMAAMIRDPQEWQDSIHVSFRDVGLLMNALAMPLHRYPMHALVQMSAREPNPIHLATTTRLQNFTTAYSKLFLYLQSMVYSSPIPPPLEVQEPHWKTNYQQMGLRELKFPEPLFYTGPDAPGGELITTASPDSSSTKLARMKSTSSPALGKAAARKSDDRSARSDSHTIKKAGKHRTRPSLLPSIGKHQKKPPPAPLAEPSSMKYYASAWRKPPPARKSDDEESLRPPSRRFLQHNHSSESSLSTPSIDSGRSPSESINSRSRNPASESSESSGSPHDLNLATSRTRAPVLRVFVPCPVLDDHSITACEDQLVRNGLWQHLSVGDIVCNLGYVPPAEEDEAGPSSGMGGSSAGPSTSEPRKWLIYIGDRLTIFSPDSAPPVTYPLSLPSPLYFIHILPAFANPKFIFAFPRPIRRSRDEYQNNAALLEARPRFELMKTSMVLPSPASRFGLAKVKRYAWVVSVQPGVLFGFEEADGRRDGIEVGDGWRADEWVLQGEGIREGYDALVHALGGGPGTEREWEVVREKSGSGRLWMRMLTIHPITNETRGAQEPQSPR